MPQTTRPPSIGRGKQGERVILTQRIGQNPAKTKEVLSHLCEVADDLNVYLNGPECSNFGVLSLKEVECVAKMYKKILYAKVKEIRNSQSRIERQKNASPDH